MDCAANRAHNKEGRFAIARGTPGCEGDCQSPLLEGFFRSRRAIATGEQSRERLVGPNELLNAAPFLTDPFVRDPFVPPTGPSGLGASGMSQPFRKMPTLLTHSL